MLSYQRQQHDVVVYRRPLEKHELYKRAHERQNPDCGEEDDLNDKYARSRRIHAKT